MGMDREQSIYVYEQSTLRYVGLNALSEPNLPQPGYIAPFDFASKIVPLTKPILLKP